MVIAVQDALHRRIVNIRPAYKKEVRPGKVWGVSPEGKPVPVPIILGITNGTHTEVISGDLREGAEIIVEENSNKASGNASTAFGRGLGR